MTRRKKPRVLMLLENASYPADSRVYAEAQSLTEAGFEITLISPARPGQPWHEIDSGVRLYRYPSQRSGGGMWGYLWEYGYSMAATLILSLWVFVRHGFDVVHAHNPPDTSVFIAALYKLVGKRFVFDHHDLAPEMYYARFKARGNRFLHRVLIWQEKLSCLLADHVIATNESYKEMEMTRGNVPENRITIVRNGPNLDRIKSVPPDEDLRRKASTIIGYVGVMGYQDGIDYLLRACRHLIDDFGRSDFFCVLIGKGDAQKELIALTRELNLEDHVWFPGFVSEEELVRYLATSDICVSPDPRNAFTDRSTMIKIMEYMALQKPIVAFDLTEHRVTAEDAALYARPNDELDFARQIESLMNDSQRRTQMGRVGRQRIETELAWSFQEKHLLEAYEKLSSHSNRSPRTLSQDEPIADQLTVS